jgi:hypothetical protein
MSEQATVPDTITISEQHFEDMRSAGADLLVRVGEQSVGGRLPRRTAALRRALEGRGLTEQDVMLQGIERTSWAWIAIVLGLLVPTALFFVMGWLQAVIALGAFVALYLGIAGVRLAMVEVTLKIRCPDAAAVNLALVEVDAHRGAEVLSIVWRYDVEPASRADWALQCIERANERSVKVASALGARITGVHAYHEAYVLPATSYPAAAPADAVASKAKVSSRMSVSSGGSFGASAASTERAGVEVTIQYRIVVNEGLQPAASPNTFR